MFLGDKTVNSYFFMNFQISISTFLWDEIQKPLLYQVLINTALCILSVSSPQKIMVMLC